VDLFVSNNDRDNVYDEDGGTSVVYRTYPVAVSKRPHILRNTLMQLLSGSLYFTTLRPCFTP